MAKFGLGMGLADLQTAAGQSPEIATLTGIERVSVKQIPIRDIIPNPDQPRKTFTPDELNDLADSIREHGVIQPIIVRQVGAKYEIVAGERRWRASQIAAKDAIPALVKSFTNENAMEIALIENVQRENLNAIEESDAYKNIMEKCGYEVRDVSRLIGKSESYIRNSLRLANLPESVKNLVKSGQLSASHARTLAVAENAEELAHRIIDNNLSVADAGELVKTAPRAATAKRAAKTGRLDYPIEVIRRLESEVEAALNLKARISVRGNGSGSVMIGFDEIQQMEALIARLKTL